jgi:hypothetical protein
MEIGQYIYKTQFVIWKSESYPDVKQLLQVLAFPLTRLSQLIRKSLTAAA